ncbi:hypothetical protein EVAR_93629_1 [Eumeta japonica]|uniref:Uncharacterized protein n=1 Tax=Eumeta variegata TaxID=151549 RepID=A0A4C1TQK8_EUMVA|nr:hypothetical protein EVAR_93629_1 [Eumeta japonica]
MLIFDIDSGTFRYLALLDDYRQRSAILPSREPSISMSDGRPYEGLTWLLNQERTTREDNEGSAQTTAIVTEHVAISTNNVNTMRAFFLNYSGSFSIRRMLHPVFRLHLPFRAKVILYKGYIRSRLTYMIVGAGRFILNYVIALDLRIETVEEFIQHIARRMYNFDDQSPYEFLRNIAPMHERSLSADRSQENFSSRLLRPEGEARSGSMRDATIMR